MWRTDCTVSPTGMSTAPMLAETIADARVKREATAMNSLFLAAEAR
jgi:hypothetical protein